MKNRLLLAAFLIAGFSVVAEEATETTVAVAAQDVIGAFVYRHLQNPSDDLVNKVKEAIKNNKVADLQLTEEQLAELTSIISKMTEDAK